MITGLNPNVFWEVGYTAAKGKPVIFAVAEEVDEALYSPVLVADALKVQYDGTIFDDEIPDQARLTDFQYDLWLFRVFSGCPVDPCAIMQFLWDRYRPLRSSLAADRAPASHKSLITFMLA